MAIKRVMYEFGGGWGRGPRSRVQVQLLQVQLLQGQLQLELVADWQVGRWAGGQVGSGRGARRWTVG